MDENQSATDNGRRILQKTARGIFWNFVAYGLSKAILLVTTAILGRLINKNDF